MLQSVPLDELAVLLAALLAGGVLTGLIAGLFGVGGGGVIVPVLYEVFGIIGVSDSVRMQLCVGTSLAVIIPTAITSQRAHMAKGAVLPGVVRTWRAPAIIGIIAGSAIAAVAPGRVLQAAFVLVIGLLGLKSLVGRNDITVSDHLPGAGAMRAYGFFIGLASSLVGISGGGIATNILLLYGVPIHAAVATSAGIGIIIPIPGVIGYAIAGWPHLSELPPLSIGYVSVIGFLCIAPLAAFVAPFGARLAHRLARRHLEMAFGLFMLLIAARFLYAVITG
ncbi:sulfite exporter TauE/SafE family protein [Xanthobacter dioxanivorans]|uniref:Probable membrane transporter protein n=1 Tax=Xanthobacter dioxanivorans TaxID=2528964 RepID=A0A974SH36_9HYPH|nr:sulfite exporter TauE/SafE family protein [Xanthobacter dioxanivorans]QRG05305.1 sulfite exporter TauE/SafE family protein [Xanthobacter dioxanivorans]